MFTRASTFTLVGLLTWVCAVAVTPAYSFMSNPSFEEPGGGSSYFGTPPGWQRYVPSNFGSYLTPYDWKTHGEYCLTTYSKNLYSFTAGDYMYHRQDVDLTGTGTILFDVKLSAPGGWLNVAKAQVLVDGVAYWTQTGAGTYLGESINVAALSGIHTLELRLEMTSSGTFGSQWVQWDNFRTPSVQGSLTLLTPNGGEEWIAGSVGQIAWETEGTVDDVFIEYSVDNGASWVGVDTVNNTGSYPWSVPQENSQQSLVRVSNASNPTVNDASDSVFTIYTCADWLTADLNGNCTVNWEDFAVFAEQWLRCGNPFDPNCQEPQ